jgi:hypothetical protein
VAVSQAIGRAQIIAVHAEIELHQLAAVKKDPNALLEHRRERRGIWLQFILAHDRRNDPSLL